MKTPFYSLAAVLGLLGPVCGAPITWTSGPTSTVDENSISLSGTLVHAGSWGTAPITVPVGSETIPFADAPTGTVLGTNNAIATAAGEFNDGNVWAAPGATNANFNTVMDGTAFDGVNPKVLVLGGLQTGAIYQIQLFASDDRSCCSGRTQKWSDNPTNGSGNETATFTHGSSSYVIGTFTASGPTQTVYGFGVAQAQTMLNAYVLRKISDPLDDDADGLPNVYEVLYAFLDANDPADAALDFDGDGLTNLREYQNSTRPDLPDTDGDGLTDGEEVDTYGSNPTLVDSDFDTLNDFQEVITHGTNPLVADSDGDLFTDAWEVSAGSNPLLSTSTPNGAQLSFLGTGTGALLTSDLTDPENDGSDATLEGLNFNWVSAVTSTKSNFSAAEGGLNIFDNKVGGGEAKFCCDGGVWTATVRFPALTAITHFTITSSNDAPERDPRVWQIQGSNDGVNFVNLISFNWTERSLWTARDQVLRVNLPQQSYPYTYIRYRVQSSGGPNNALGELELFGEVNGTDADADGLPKLVEDFYAFLSDSNASDADTDFDGDGLSNLEEYLAGTNLAVADSDGDGLSDGDEVLVYFTNPLVSDSDGDGLSDGDEVNVHGSDPQLVDTDDDFFKDGYEVLSGSDPADASSTPGGVTVSVAGFGTSGLLKGDVTDRDNDGVESATPTTTGFDWVSITASSKPFFHGFGGTEGAFDVFDNKVGGGEAKWCCDNAPQQLTVELPYPIQMTHFTMASGDDAPERDPRVWSILGSNDGVTFTPIFTMGDTTRQFWTQRGQVLRFDLESPAPSYRYLRYSVSLTGGNLHQISEIEYFGIEQDTDGDGLPDFYEDRYAFLDKDDPSDAALDQDGDGLSNLAEYQNKTLPNNSDTDGDGLSDAVEVNVHGTSPLLADSDGDQIPDGFEVAKGSDPNDSLSLPDFTPVVWGPATNITGTTADFNTSGTLVHAWTGGGTNVTIQSLGITFQPGPSLGNRFTGYDPYNRGGDADYEALLNSGTYDVVPRFVQIPGLTAGRTYRVQLWLADTRNGTGGREWTIGTYDLDDPEVTLASGEFGNEANRPGQWVTGTFTATDATHFLFIEGLAGSQYNAITVYDTAAPAQPLEVVSSGFNGGSFELQVSGFDTGKQYRLLRSTTLNNDFAPVGSAFTPTASSQTVSDPSPPAGKAFYVVEEVN